jgi:hypothetical protein
MDKTNNLFYVEQCKMQKNGDGKKKADRRKQIGVSEFFLRLQVRKLMWIDNCDLTFIKLNFALLWILLSGISFVPNVLI